MAPRRYLRRLHDLLCKYLGGFHDVQGGYLGHRRFVRSAIVAPRGFIEDPHEVSGGHLKVCMRYPGGPYEVLLAPCGCINSPITNYVDI